MKFGSEEDMKIGRRIYYDLSSGNVILDTGERNGSVIETTIEQDFQNYKDLAERLPETVGFLQFNHGDLAYDFATCNGFRVDLESGAIVFSYPDLSNPEQPPIYRKPLSQEVDELKQSIAELTILLATPQQ
ncbi:hypothetical protein NV379_23340 [Paenibacillus sp. N1-5-1-14]|uniref:hypothetical protein n=1 Tax=Paenibacillus radicibacter TaxID=2972488 RepID=UPI002158FD51|nr:hypothetical protein [Paenibacillus radicibacter]MCR8645577.1 hypothetical protein [Paenibacillus radicibacter]